MSGCTYRRCGVVATREPELVLRARVPGKGVVVVGRALLSDLRVCAGHAACLTAESFVTERAWSIACAAVVAQGRPRPHRELLGLRYRTVSLPRLRLV